ncbi:transposase, MuDR [Artemisia annua]|uniref:Transposase, MuDR n=1 Tax=Artemisia annua TaxID=35608 RepID=A0A2U1NMY1_ARTAN|nr:transposase, MuDR [Artemisia annua]
MYMITHLHLMPYIQESRRPYLMLSPCPTNQDTLAKISLHKHIRVYFRFQPLKALNHYALTNEFEYFIEKSEPTRFTARCAQLTCGWRIHAARLQDGVTFKVKKFSDSHTCIRSNKGGNKCATQGWIASVIKDKLKSDGDVSVTKLKKWLMKHYSVEVPYLKVFRGKEQAYTDMYGKWEDSFIKNLGEYEICRSNENRAAVKCKGKRWEVILDERKCTCRVWQVKGLPCVHAAAFIAFLRDYNWEKYVDEYFTIEKLKEAYAMEIAPMLAMNEWVHTETGQKIYPPRTREEHKSSANSCGLIVDYLEQVIGSI